VDRGKQNVGKNHIIGRPMKYCLQYYGFWPQRRFYIGAVIVATAMVALLPFQFAYAWKLRSDMVLMMDSLKEISKIVMIGIKFFIMWRGRRLIMDLIRDVLNDWSAGPMNREWEILAWYSRLFCSADIISYFVGTAYYYPALYINNSGTSRESKQFYLRSVCPSIFYDPPVFQIFITIQIIECVTLGVAESICESLLFALVVHTGARRSTLEGYFEALSRKCNECSNSDDRRQIMIMIVREHLYMKNLVRRINKIYSNISLFTVAFNNVIVCASGFLIITSAGSVDFYMMVGFVLLIFWIIFQAFVFCALGEYTRTNGEKIFEAACKVPWYMIEPREMKMLVMILANAQRPLMLSGGKMFSLSYNSFLQ
ncbi:hypothetical protein QAD02_001095, partial [Eretmocerus hayati]